MYGLGVFLLLLCRLYILILLARVVLDFVQIISPLWRPTGMLLPLAIWVYKLTDPPMRFIGKFIPPLRLGAVAIDIGFIVLWIGVSFIETLIRLLLLH